MAPKSKRTGLPKYRWVLIENDPSESKPRWKRIAAKTGVSELLARVLVARGYDTPDVARRYLKPLDAPILPPESIPGLEQARDRLLAAALGKEAVLIHGDYDVDGISGTVILFKTLKELGCRPRIFLPERTIHGYGLAPQAVEKAKKAGIKLLVTVDCGISSPETVAAARSAGIEVIVTDHHGIPKNPPRDAIMVHPELEGDYPGGRIAGATVAYKLALSLIEASGNNIDDAMEVYLPLVAMATVADVCDLTLENRALVAQGLPAIPRSRLPGLRVLYEGTRSGRNGGEAGVNERDIAFSMAPTMNAAGRMGNPLPAAQLLLAESMESAWKHFRKLDRLNRDRRKAQDETCFRLSRRPEVAWETRGGILVLIDEECTAGLAGLAASRLAEQTGRPTCVLVPGEDEAGPLYRGSMRGVRGEDLMELVTPVESIAERIGGHAGALGLTVRPERIEEFKTACGKVKWSPKPPELELDCMLESAPRDESAVRELDLTRPWGPGNPQPAFAWGPVTIKGTRTVGRGMEHVQLSLHDSAGSLYKGIGFNMAEDLPKDDGAVGRTVTAAGHFQLNNWLGTETVEFQVKDLDFDR